MRVIAALLIALCALPAAAFESRRITIEHDGRSRTALIDARADAWNAPVLIGLHGGLAGPMSVRRRAQVSLAAEGWVVLWPYAVEEGDWNDGRRDDDGRLFDETDDVGFLRSLVARLAEAGVADPSRVFVAGPSLGGTMALKLLCDAPDLVAGAAVAIASLPVGADCAEGPPRPVLLLHGTADRIMPEDGGRIGGWSPLVRERGDVRPVSETMEILAARNGCAGYEERALPDRAADDGSTVRLRAYEGCEAPLLHYIVEGGGHAWPGSRSSRLGGIVGPTNQDISATAEIERFFRALAAAE